MVTQSETFDPHAFDRLVSSEGGHFWFEERCQLIVWALRRYFPHAQDFCDMGCGTGFVLAALVQKNPTLKLTGIDPYPQALAHAGRRAPTAKLHRGDILTDDFPAAFDVIGCFDVLEHLPDDQRALNCLAARLRPGGGLILTVPQHPWLWSASDEFGHHQRRYTRSLLIAKLSASGFTCLRITSFVTFLLPVLWLRRTRSFSREQALAELHPGPVANRLGKMLLQTERAWIAGGGSFPWGGSLLVVATKPRA